MKTNVSASKFFPIGKRINVLAPLKIGLILALFAIIYALILVILFGNDENDGDVFTLNYVVAAIAIAPLVESVVLVFMVEIFKRIGFKAKFYLPIVAVLAMLAHIPGRDDLKILPVQLFVFYIFAYYVDFRSAYVKRLIFLCEAIAMHSFYNVICVLLPFFVVEYFSNV
nr:hypothetical protein [uncultured Albidiferax sp.]